MSSRVDHARATPTLQALGRTPGRARLLAVLSAMGLLLALSASPALAQAGGPTKTHNVQPMFVAGNPSCTTIVSGADHSFKIDSPATGPFTDPVTGVTFLLKIPSDFETPNEGPSFYFVV